MGERIAVVMSEVFLRRLTPALAPFVRPDRDFRILSIHRPAEELLRRLRELGCDGLLTEWLPGVTEALLGAGVPAVVADTDFRYEGVSSVDVDDWRVGREAAEAFRQSGARHLACLGNRTPYSEQRIAGFRGAASGAVAVHNVPETGAARYSEHFGAPDDRLARWLEALPKPCGVFATHDPLGRFLCGACRQLGWRVPEDIAVIGANNDPLVCGLTYPTLSSVRIPWDALGALVGREMERLLRGGTPPDGALLLPPGGVVLRHSANHLAVEDAVVRRVMCHFSAHLASPLTVGGVCATLRLARRVVERRFRNTYGLTPWAMLCRLRVNRAKGLLLETHQPVTTIAEQCGFGEPGRFSVVFRRVAGVTPSAYRRMPAPVNRPK